MKIIRIYFIILLGTCVSAHALEESQQKKFEKIGEELAASGPIELKELRIQAKIYEPQVIYILDHAKMDVDVKEQEIDFRSRILAPLEDNQF